MVAAATYEENLNIGRALKVVGSGANAAIISANDPNLSVVHVTTPIMADRP